MDLLIEIVRSSSLGDRQSFRKAVEAMIADERTRQHHILADRLASLLNQPTAPDQVSAPAFRKTLPNGPYFEKSPSVGLSSLVLSDAVTRACSEIVEEQHRADLLRSYNLEPRHRILLAGPPGNGKTSLAEALATELMLPLFAVRLDAMAACDPGERMAMASKLFEEARTRRCVLLIDGFDPAGRGDYFRGPGEIWTVARSLLLQADSLPSYVLAVAATSRPELLDPIVWGRFEVRLELPAPTAGQIGEWFRRFEESLGTKLGVGRVALANRLKGASFSELEEFCLDVRRRRVLSLPDGDVREIVADRLSLFESRYGLEPKGAAE